MWFKKKMADEAKKEQEPKVDPKAEVKAEQNVGAESQQNVDAESQQNVDAESLPRQEKDSTSDGRGKDSASTAEKPAEPDWKTLYALTLADFDNYKKRAARDREDTYRFAEADILKDVLPSIDNLALALASAKNVDAESKQNVDAESLPRQEKDSTFDAFVKGVQLVYDTLLKAFKDHSAEPFDSVGKELDPETMEAIATLPSPDYDEGKVSTEVKRGWMLKGKLLRAAQVVVSSGKPPAPATESN